MKKPLSGNIGKALSMKVIGNETAVDKNMVEANAVRDIRRFIMQRAGLYFEKHDLSALQVHIARRMEATGCPSPGDYFTLLTQSPMARDEFTRLLNLLTIKHTHFFRYATQFTALRDKILPELVVRKMNHGDMTLSILSAGCSTGEEPYSIAMVLLDLLGTSTLRRCQILATDISTEALETARKGIYSRRALRFVDQEFIERYMERFCHLDRKWITVNPEVRDLVQFQYMNLMDEFLPWKFDLIFCRNVTIYFEPETTKRVLEKFHRSLLAGGYFFSGGTETMFGISDRFELAERTNALIFRKVASAAPAPRAAITVSEEPAAAESVKKRVSSRPAPVDKNTCDRDGDAPDARELFQQAKLELACKNYQKAAELARQASLAEPQFHEVHTLLAHIFFSMNRLDDAERECLQAVDLNSLSAEPHYLLGHIQRKKKHLLKAVENLRKAIYLNSNYSLAHYTLAELHKERGQVAEAVKAYRNTLKALEMESEDEVRASSGGFTKRVLAQVCMKNIKKISRTWRKKSRE
jgi:chemotaxis protein methyltransferase CheR